MLTTRTLTQIHTNNTLEVDLGAATEKIPNLSHIGEFMPFVSGSRHYPPRFLKEEAESEEE